MLEVYMGTSQYLTVYLADLTILDDIRKHQHLITHEVTTHMSRYEVMPFLRRRSKTYTRGCIRSRPTLRLSFS